MKAPNHLQKRQLDLRDVRTAFDKNLKEVSSVNPLCNTVSLNMDSFVCPLRHARLIQIKDTFSIGNLWTDSHRQLTSLMRIRQSFFFCDVKPSRFVVHNLNQTR